MKVVLLAGGYGTRLSEETITRPKPMVEVGGMPILWHIMKIYSYYGHNDFIVCLGYKGYMIKEYFANYFLHMADVTFDMSKNKMIVHNQKAEPWRVTLVDTGEKTFTGGRLKRVANHIDEDNFMLTYGDGLADINIQSLLEFHVKHNKIATVTAVQTSGRFGALDIDDDFRIRDFMEKPKGDGSWINGGFFVLKKEALNYIEGDNTIWERSPLEQLAHEGELVAYKHTGYWKPMDTLRDMQELNNKWENGKAIWKKW